MKERHPERDKPQDSEAEVGSQDDSHRSVDPVGKWDPGSAGLVPAPITYLSFSPVSRSHVCMFLQDWQSRVSLAHETFPESQMLAQCKGVLCADARPRGLQGLGTHLWCRLVPRGLASEDWPAAHDG